MLIAWATIFCNSCCRLSLNNCVIFILKPNWTKKNFENLTVLCALHCDLGPSLFRLRVSAVTTAVWVISMFLIRRRVGWGSLYIYRNTTVPPWEAAGKKITFNMKRPWAQADSVWAAICLDHVCSTRTDWGGWSWRVWLVCWCHLLTAMTAPIVEEL